MVAWERVVGSRAFQIVAFGLHVRFAQHPTNLLEIGVILVQRRSLVVESKVMETRPEVYGIHLTSRLHSSRQQSIVLLVLFHFNLTPPILLHVFSQHIVRNKIKNLPEWQLTKKLWSNKTHLLRYRCWWRRLCVLWHQTSHKAALHRRERQLWGAIKTVMVV